ncbi:MAG: DEAD/DEAH box helicase, partial [Desulfovibrio sp.]
MNYETGSLVSFRGREWVVLPPMDTTTLMLKPLGGVDAEIVRIFPQFEKVSSATFSLPKPNEVGDATSCAILRDAVRLGLRSTTGPFRSFGHIAVEPRPYQLVPLLMAMKQPVIRLLIADDVGIGKTVEALLIAKEMLDRGEVRRMSILCPPQLAEQWQKELADKFHIHAKLVLPSTVNRLERGLGAGTSLFEKYPFTIVSLDFIKSDKHRNEFLRACPELVIVDEAHACASASGGKGRKQRYELVSELAKNPARHMRFVTATPHSG